MLPASSSSDNEDISCQKIEVVAKTMATEDESVKLGKEAHVHLMKMDVLDRVKHAVNLRVKVRKLLLVVLGIGRKLKKELNQAKAYADSLIKKYTEESNADDGIRLMLKLLYTWPTEPLIFPF